IIVHDRSKEGGLQIDIDANPSLYTTNDLQTHLGRFIRLLEAVVADADRSVGQIDLLTPEERKQILEEWNRTAREIPQATLPELFEEQAQKTPEAVAVVYEGREITYRELNEQANRLAHLLIGEGIGPEDVVGLAVERSREMVVSLLGIMKAGAAYLPLDPDYPIKRLAFMLEDAAPVCVLTTGEMAERLPEGARLLILDEPEIVHALAG